VGEAFDVLGSLLGDAGFGCGLHGGLRCRRFLDLRWLSWRSLFYFAGAGRCRLSCGGPTRAGCCRLTSCRSMLTRHCGLLTCGAAPRVKALSRQPPGALRYCVSALRLPSVLRFCARDSCLLRRLSSCGPALNLKFIRHANTFERCKCGRRSVIWDGDSYCAD
jgi:hypothetical protein